MKVKSIDINEITVKKIDSKTGVMNIQISFIGDQPIFTTLNINDSHEQMAERIISETKRQMKPVDNDDDDVLGGIGIINIANDDDIRERLGKGIMRLEQRYAKMKRTSSATEYIRAYSQFSTSEDLIYKKGF